jgi:hypothetical protein
MYEGELGWEAVADVLYIVCLEKVKEPWVMGSHFSPLTVPACIMSKYVHFLAINIESQLPTMVDLCYNYEIYFTVFFVSNS